MPSSSRSPDRAQRGGTLLGIIIGLVIGLTVALVAAVYITKAPLPFMNRFQQRGASAASGSANWNPNAGIEATGTPPPAAGPAGTGTVASAPLSPKALQALGEAPAGVVRADGAAPVQAANDNAPAAAPTPAAAAADLQYILQIGAYGNRSDAESQRAKVALTGLEARIDEREVDGHTLYRVRVGPFPSSDQADKAQKTLSDNGVDAAVVKVPK
jgi:cell division protein FtsN